MARTAALGDGPVSFFRNGVLIEVPLSALYFENDVVGTTRADLALQPEFVAWITFLKSRGRLVADVAPQPAKALTVKAADTGSLGNSIQFTVAPKSAPGVTPVTVDVTVTETDKYEGVTLATLATLVGIKAGTAGTRPGLLWLTAAPTAATSALVPVESPPPAGVTVTAGAGALPTWVITTAAGPGGAAGATVFTLEPRRPGAGATLFDASNLKLVSISNVRPAAAGATGPTFTLTVTWSKTIADVTLSPATIATTLAPLGYLVTINGPDGAAAAITKVPQTGTVVLTGGSDTVAPVNATATVMAAD